MLLLLISCNDKSENNLTLTKNEKKSTIITIVLQPFVDFPDRDLIKIEKELKKYYSKIILKNPIEIPKSCLNKIKTRYRADSIITFLNQQTTEGFVTIGLTTKDISTTKGKISDWGIYGSGFCPGKSSIVSSFRLKGNNKFEKLVKVAVHELGHTQGLHHCLEKTCLMRDAEGKDHLNEEKEFCNNCKKILIKNGWKLS